MSEANFIHDEFDTEIGDLEVKKVKVFDRTWKIGPGGSIMTRPLLLNGVAYFGSYNQNVYAVSADDGTLEWKFHTNGPIGPSAPVADGERVFFGSFDFNVYALDHDTGKLAWKCKTEGPVARAVCVHGDSVYAGSKDGYLHCIDRESGKLRWKFRTFGYIACPPAAAGDRIFFGSYDQNFYCLDTEGKVRWKVKTQAEINLISPPLVHDGVVYFGSFDNYLYAVDIGTGNIIWKIRRGDYGISACPVQHEGIIYHASRDGSFCAFTPEGETLWTFRSPTPEVWVAPLIDNGRIFIGSGDQHLYCLDMEGRQLWRFYTQGHVWWQPAAWKDSVVFSSWDCNIYSVKAGDGKLNWKFGTGGSPCFIPPPYEYFEMQMKIPVTRLEEERKKNYELDFSGEGEEDVGAYKSRITYQVSNQYVEKGKYQIDSDEEEF
jgi:outer membrane protein assembly factor BamB